jgi:anti-sigma factor RsiW
MERYPPGWTCDLIVLRLELYLVSVLPRAESLAVAEHLEMCPECAALLAAIQFLRVESGSAPTARAAGDRAPSGRAGARRSQGKDGRGRRGG